MLEPEPDSRGAVVSERPETLGHDRWPSRSAAEYDIMRVPRGARARTTGLSGREFAPRGHEPLAEEVSHV
jgi:hypothetical protein